MDEQQQDPEDLEKASLLPAVLWLAPSQGPCFPRCVSAVRPAPVWKMAVEPRPQQSHYQAWQPGWSLRLAGCCEGGCITGLSAGHGACWFWVRRSSQSKQVHHPLPFPSPGALDWLVVPATSWHSQELVVLRSCLVITAGCPGPSHRCFPPTRVRSTLS